jgi:hypothetical protein
VTTLAWALAIWLAGLAFFLGLFALGKRADRRARALFREARPRRPVPTSGHPAYTQHAESLGAARDTAGDLPLHARNASVEGPAAPGND